MTEREKQIEAVDKCIRDYEGSGGQPISCLRHKAVKSVLNALAPWLNQSTDYPGLVSHLVATTASFENRITRLEENERMAAQPKTPTQTGSLPTKPEFTVRIMRKNGSKWHVVSTESDREMAIGCADRWYSDPEIKAVEVTQHEAAHEPTTEQLLYVRRKP